MYPNSNTCTELIANVLDNSTIRVVSRSFPFVSFSKINFLSQNLEEKIPVNSQRNYMSFSQSIAANVYLQN